MELAAPTSTSAPTEAGPTGGGEAAPVPASQAAEADRRTEEQRESEAATDALFVNLDPSQAATEIESYCVNCGENGVTRLLLTRIPHFREVVIMAFECPHCNYRNNEIQSAGAIAEKGCAYTCHVADAKDLDRQIVRSEWATVHIPALDFEVPPTNEHGSLTTIEGFVMGCIGDLDMHQAARKTEDPDTYAKIELFLARLRGLLTLQQPFDLVLDDPSGTSYIENLYVKRRLRPCWDHDRPAAPGAPRNQRSQATTVPAPGSRRARPGSHLPRADPQLHLRLYVRTLDQERQLGLAPPVEAETTDKPDYKDECVASIAQSTGTFWVAAALDESVMVFPSTCSQCGKGVECRMHELNLPYFSEVILMAATCEHCGYRTTEVKSGGVIAEKGRRIELKITDPEDLSRDVLKSDSCSVSIPELELELGSGTLGSRFTTIEGLLDQIYEEIRVNPFLTGDSSRNRHAFDSFLERLKRFSKGDMHGTFILNDPLGLSYLQNLYAPDPDPNMTITEYERSWEDNEEFGLNDIQTEGYQAGAAEPEPVQAHGSDEVDHPVPALPPKDHAREHIDVTGAASEGPHDGDDRHDA